MIDAWSQLEREALRQWARGELFKAKPLDAAGYRRSFSRTKSEFESALAGYAARLAADDISPGQFRQYMTSTIRTSYIEAYRLGASAQQSSRALLTEMDHSRILASFSDELNYLDQFAREIRENDYSSRYLDWRTGLYAKALHGVFYEGLISRVDPDQQECWYRSRPDACPACRAAATGSPYHPDACPRPGAATCVGLDNCRCSVEIRPRRRTTLLQRGAHLDKESRLWYDVDVEKAFNPSELRIPGGHLGGGRWTVGGVAGLLEDLHLPTASSGHWCKCGCGLPKSPKSQFRPGHDARHKSNLIRRAIEHDDQDARQELQDRGWGHFLEAKESGRPLARQIKPPKAKKEPLGRLNPLRHYTVAEVGAPNHPDTQRWLRELDLVPDAVHEQLAATGTELYIDGTKTVPDLDDQGHLRDIQPSGYPAGATWSQVGGAYNWFGRRTMVGSSARSGSVSTMLHEMGHAIDHAFNNRDAPEVATMTATGLSGTDGVFAEIWRAMTPDLPAYYQRDIREFFAESWARYWKGESMVLPLDYRYVRRNGSPVPIVTDAKVQRNNRKLIKWMETVALAELPKRPKP